MDKQVQEKRIQWAPLPEIIKKKMLELFHRPLLKLLKKLKK
jgi:hypothetical protein